MPAKGRRCPGVIKGTVKCTLARNGSGDPIVVTGACRGCGEWRCRTHCGCGKQGHAQGRQAARPGAPAGAKVQPKTTAHAKICTRPGHPAVPCTPPIVGRPSALSVETYTDDSWMAKLASEIQTAGVVHVSSMIVDDPDFCTAVGRRLRGRGSFACTVVVDKSQYMKRTSRFQRPRLLELQRLGAQVYLAGGFNAAHLFGVGAHSGILHLKGVVLDNRVLYVGSSNLTKASRANREVMFRMTGPPVAKTLQGILAAVQCGETLRDK